MQLSREAFFDSCFCHFDIRDIHVGSDVPPGSRQRDPAKQIEMGKVGFIQ